MKKNYTFLLLLFFTVCFSQIPSGYYDTATGTGYTLKTQLYNIIKGHTDNGYAGLYTTYQTSDVDNFYENDGTVLDMYSENPSGTDPYNYSIGSTQRCGNYSAEGDCYNREHIIPQSVFNEQSPMVADAHFITPTDGKVNGIRSNYPHGTVSSATYTSQNGGKLGSSSVSGYSGTVFEPIDAFKGDIARMYFYFATRYENTVAGYSYAMFDGSSNKVFTTAFLNVLLAWNSQDPVSAREIARNNAIYARQNNRNPY
ncbi:HNH endonuclease signature motif containing protein, partial [Flavobacterium sp. CF136]|uniref:HNH endonuclease signature motif containing protein n=1 Tax=Flavobacterium sp. (strain CF136) TaxID=1144313 RepID=UPI000271B0DD